MIKIINSKRIADGVLRFYFVAGERALEKIKEDAMAIDTIA